MLSRDLCFLQSPNQKATKVFLIPCELVRIIDIIDKDRLNHSGMENLEKEEKNLNYSYIKVLIVYIVVYKLAFWI